jgi:enoyl-CoA hydratase
VPDVLLERNGALFVVTLNRPQRKNALDFPAFEALAAAWDEVRADDSIRCVVVTGAGGDFCAGGDLRAAADEANRGRDLTVVRRALLRDERLPKPLVAAVEGAAIAGGTELLLAADIRVAAVSARIGLAEARWSMHPMMGGAVRLPRHLPRAVAAQMLLTGAPISATDAYQWGFVGALVPDGQALATAMELASAVARNGPLAVESILRTLHETDGMEEAEAFRHEEGYATAVNRSEDALEGPKAFAEKRDPVYRRR